MRKVRINVKKEIKTDFPPIRPKRGTSKTDWGRWKNNSLWLIVVGGLVIYSIKLKSKVLSLITLKLGLLAHYPESVRLMSGKLNSLT